MKRRRLPAILATTILLAAPVLSARADGPAVLEFQPDQFARHNIAFYLNGELAEPSVYGVTAGVRFYFGPDKPLIRRHREDDPGAAEAWEGLAAELSQTAGAFTSAISGLPGAPWTGPATTTQGANVPPW